MKTNYNNISERAKNGKNGVQLVYVLDCIKNSSSATDQGLNFETDADALKFFFETFDKEFNYTYNKHRFPCLQNRICEYLRGLPSCCCVDFYTSEILKLGLIWGVIDSPEGRKAEKFAENWFNVLGLRLLQAACKCKLNPYKYTV